MSRIGNKPIDLPTGVTVTVAAGKVSVKGAKGTLDMPLRPEVKVEVKGTQVLITNIGAHGDRHARSYHGTTRARIAGMVSGVATGYEKNLEIIGVGFNAKIQGKEVILSLGFANTVKVPIPAGITIESADPTRLSIKGSDKQAVGQIAAQIRKIRPPEPYKGKGVKYTTETIKRKAGKAFGSA